MGMLAGMGVPLFSVDSSMMGLVGCGDVERGVDGALLAAPSAGSYFREEMDGFYPHRQVRGRR